MSASITITTPSGHFTVTARPWNDDQRHTVIRELREVLNSLILAFPELTAADTAEYHDAAGDLIAVGTTDTRAAYAALTTDDLR